MKELVPFLGRFVLISAVLFVGFTMAEESYNRLLAQVTAITAPLTGASVSVDDVQGNAITLSYAGRLFRERLIFAAFNPVVLIALLAAAPELLRRVFYAGVGGLVLVFYAWARTDKGVFGALALVVLGAMLLSARGKGRRLAVTAVGGLAVLLLAQVLTLRLLLAIDLRGYRGTPGLEVLEVLTLASICLNWVLPIVVWVIWAPAGFISSALRVESRT